MSDTLETIIVDDPYRDMGITPEELQDKTEVDTSKVDEEVVGTEDFSLDMSKKEMINPALVEATTKKNCMFIRTTGDDVYRIYFRSDTRFTSELINRICRFLDTRTEKETVVFMLGVDFDNEMAQQLGPILSSIMTCKANTIGCAMGLCSLSETMIWSYCKMRKVMRYGALQFSKPVFIKVCKEYEHYFKVFYDKVVNDLHLLTQGQVEEIYTKNTSIMKMYNEFQ